ncbi:HAMP domain-containing protein, partial [Planomonospora parontospora]|uniref:HAMP domain-containing protein n=2 Tax=Planomonospora parontospora TaxID=58119 RepID=UPI001670A55B
MSHLDNLGVGRRLGLSFTLVSLLIALSVGVGQWALHRQADLTVRMDRLEQVEDDIQTFAYHVADLTGWQGLVAADAGTAMGGKAATAADSMNREGELYAKKSLYETLENTRVEYLTPAERARFDKLEPAWDQFFVEDDKVMALLAQDTVESRTAAMENINGGPASDAWATGLEITQALQKSLSDRIAALEKEAVQIDGTSQKVLWGTLAAALLLAAVLSVRVTRSVVRPLTVVMDALGRVARGDLTVRLGMTRRDELGRLGRALDDTTESLRTTVSTVVAHSDALATSSAHLSQVSERIA